MPRYVHAIGVAVAALALAGLATFSSIATAAADPTPGYPGGYPGGGSPSAGYPGGGYPGGGYPGGGYGGGGTPGGIDTTHPVAGGGITVTAACGSGAGATLTFDGVTIGTATVANGTAVLTGTVPADATGAHKVVATCDSGQVYSFTVTVQSPSSGSGGGGALASTGARIGMASGAGAVLLAGGVGLVLIARRRQRSA